VTPHSEQTFGTWQLESIIAVGGLGEVWRARREGQLAALKRLHTHLARNEDGRAMFALEQQLALGLPRHPNLVHAIETGVVDARPYVALELAPGEDLRRLVAGAVLPRARVLAIVRAACAGVAHLHKFGWVHGDINPGNLIVDVDDRVTVIDLGVARKSGEAGSVRGTHAYMAPEQVKGGAWSPATDVFALGVVLWELASGTRLFHRGPPWLSMAAVVEADVPPLEDPALDAVARAALAKDPAARIATPAELAARL
jgi:serine/threonine-protein kinase